MALIRCPECGGKLSTRALWCPHCGIRKVYFARITKVPKYDDNAYYICEESKNRLRRGLIADIIKGKQLILFTPAGEIVNAEYYNDDLVFISGKKYLLSSLKERLSESGPIDKIICNIKVCSPNIKEHGIGIIKHIYCKDEKKIIEVHFPDSKLLTGKKTTCFDIEKALNNGGISPMGISLADFQDIIEQVFSETFDLEKFLCGKDEERVRILSARKGVKFYMGKCAKCQAPVNSADNLLCDVCKGDYICNMCGYCPTCHAAYDPAVMERTLWERIPEGIVYDDYDINRFDF